MNRKCKKVDNFCNIINVLLSEKNQYNGPLLNKSIDLNKLMKVSNSPRHTHYLEDWIRLIQPKNQIK